MKFFFIFFLFYIELVIKKINSYVVFPLKTLEKENYIFYKDESEKSILKKFYYSDIYTKL